MKETEMGYRGSKSRSVLQTDLVKEQRVEGSYCIAKNNKMQLRCTLMGFERNYPVKFPSKQFNARNFSTSKSTTNVNPWFWTGLIDAEGSFSIIIKRNIKRTLGWQVESKFQIGLDKNDISLLLQLQEYLGGIGAIYKYPTRNIVNYSVSSVKDMLILISHFEQYPLLTQKAAFV